MAEGASINTKKEFVKFLYIAHSSLSELGTPFEVASRLGSLEKE